MKYYCISIKENHKERSLCREIFKNISMPVDFHIVNKSEYRGCFGCFESHIDVLKRGIKYLEKNPDELQFIMVMEDDVYFESKIDINLLEFLSNRKEKWCCCLGYFTASQATKIKHNIISLPKCYCGHAYIVPIQTAKELVKMEYNGTPYDIIWHNVIDIFYAPYPMIAFQRSHKSSISDDFPKYLMNTLGFKNVAKLCEIWSHITDIDLTIPKF
jgi:GR25 family glycosyltransferase involved in LPS biosynthesis